ncbi:MAG: hypothetical protein ACYTEQ_22650, partial [Planctomycetota bacterium]
GKPTNIDEDSTDDLTTATGWTGDLTGTGSSPQVVDDSHNHLVTNIDAFTKAQLEGRTSDVSDYAEADGDTYSGTHDFSAATVSLPSGAVDDAGDISNNIITNAHFTHSTDWGDVSIDTMGDVQIDSDVVGATELGPSGVTPGSYTLTDITVDGDKRNRRRRAGGGGLFQPYRGCGHRQQPHGNPYIRWYGT